MVKSITSSDSSSISSQKEEAVDKVDNSVYARLFGKEKIAFFSAILAALIKGLFPALQINVFGDFIDLVPQETFGADTINDLVLLLVYFGIGTGLSDAVANGLMEYVAVKLVENTKRDFMNSLLKQEAAYYDENDPMTMTSILYINTMYIRDGSGLKISQMVAAMASFISFWGVAFFRDWRISLALLCFTPITAAGATTLFGRHARSNGLAAEVYQPAASLAEESVGYFRTVTAFSLSNVLKDQYFQTLAATFKVEKIAFLYKATAMCFVMTLVLLQIATGWFVSGRLMSNSIADGCDFMVDSSCFSPGNAMSCLICAIMAGQQFQQISPNIAIFKRAKQATAALNAIIYRQPIIDAYRGDEETDRARRENRSTIGDIVFDNVTFAYPSRQNTNILSNFSHTFGEGRSTALVGPSGCGKSTIIQLIMRFYKPNSGKICFDGDDEYDLVSARAAISIVTQEPRLFSNTIYENVAMGITARSKLSDIEEHTLVMDACRRAQCLDFIGKFKLGVYTNVGSGGSLLSGGQRQRVNIARALARNPELLILDEATSALDNKSEREVQKAIDDIMRDGTCTVITIAHRLTTIVNCDSIVVFNRTPTGAEVVETGSHSELMEAGGLYRSLYTAQTDPTIPTDANVEHARDIIRSLSGIEHEKIGLMFPRQLDFGLYELDAERKRQCRLEEKEVAKSFQSQMKLSTEGVGRRAYKDLWDQKNLPLITGTITGLLGGLVFCSLPVVNSYATGAMIDNLGDADQTWNDSMKYACIYVGIAMIGGPIFFIREYSWSWASETLCDFYRRNVFSSLMGADVGYFDDTENSPGKVSDLLSSDCKQIRGLVGDNSWVFLHSLGVVIFTLTYIFITCWELALVGIIQVAPNLIGQMLLAKSMKSGFSASRLAGQGVGKTEAENEDSVGFVINEFIQNIKVIHSFNLQGRTFHDFTKACSRDFARDGRSCVKTALVGWISNTLSGFATALAYYYGGNLMFDPTFGVQYDNKVPLVFRDFMSVVVVCAQAGNTIGFVQGLGADSAKAKNSLQSIYKMMTYEPLVPIKGGLDAIELLKSVKDGDVILEAKDVSFSYPCRIGVKVYNGINFQIKRGQKVAIVGPSGAGKSTFLQLLERFYSLRVEERHNTRGEPLTGTARGEILMAGESIENICPLSLREVMSMVEQQPALFSTLGSIEANIRGNKLDVPVERIVEAAKRSSAHDFIEALPDGYETNVGMAGGMLSGGQKQRIAIARALVSEPTILLLDEATSALDVVSEKEVQGAIDHIVRTSGMTTITIAHRMSTIRQSDNIIVLGNPGDGTVVLEQGDHESLIEKKGTYFELVQMIND